LRHGKPVLLRLPEIDFINDGPGKPVGIHEQVAAQLRHSEAPLATCKCSNTRWDVAVSVSPSLCITPTPNGNGRATEIRQSVIWKRRSEARAKGWTVVGMKSDWKAIFPFGNK
jgi:hypothetical protein